MAVSDWSGASLPWPEVLAAFDLLLSFGAPRSMKMGTIASPWRYDAETCGALQSAILRRPSILRYASGTIAISSFIDIDSHLRHNIINRRNTGVLRS
jgi:hypothetical protein